MTGRNRLNLLNSQHSYHNSQLINAKLQLLVCKSQTLSDLLPTITIMQHQHAC